MYAEIRYSLTYIRDRYGAAPAPEPGWYEHGSRPRPAPTRAWPGPR